MSEGFVVRRAERRDVPAIVAGIDGLSAYHGDKGMANERDLAEDLFGAEPWAFGWVAEDETGVIGYALTFPLYRAHWGQRGMDLHHLFVDPERRKGGVGKALIDAAIAFAKDKGCAFFVVPVAPKNTKAQEFYTRLGLERHEEVGVQFTLDLRK